MAEVRREHREAAIKALEPGSPSWVGRAWIKTGKGPWSPKAEALAAMLAERDVAAEQRGRENEREDFLRILRAIEAEHAKVATHAKGSRIRSQCKESTRILGVLIEMVQAGRPVIEHCEDAPNVVAPGVSDG